MQHIDTMNDAAHEMEHSQARPVTVSLELVVYLALFLLSLVLRVAELDTIPFRQPEARQALAAWTVLRPDTFGAVPTSDSPLVLLVQTVSFSLLGATEFAARIGTALAGAALVFAPLLFRQFIGRGRAFVFCLLLAFSPVLLGASRESSGVIWTLLLAAIAGWAILRFRQTGRRSYPLLATIAAALAVFTTEPGGWLFGLILVGAFYITQWMQRRENYEFDPPATVPREVWRPDRIAFGAVVLTVLLVATGFMLHPSGLSSIGALLETSARSFLRPAPGTPLFYGLLISVFYEPFLWLLGLGGLVLAWRQGLSPLDRFFAAWLVLGVVGLIVFAGSSPAHAVWLTIPLAGLTTRAILWALDEDDRRIWHFPAWARWLVAAITFALLGAFGISLQALGRSLLRQDMSFGFQFNQIDPVGGIVSLMMLLFFVVGFFLAANLWDNTTAARGVTLGALLFGLLTSLASGWNMAVPEAGNAEEPWHFTTTTANVPLLRSTLFDIAQRDSRGVPSYPIAVQTDDAIVAWLLRDFTNVRRIGDPSEAAGANVVLLPGMAGEDVADPNLGGNYVGQDFILGRGWSLASLRPQDALTWWLEREAPIRPVPQNAYVLWLRADLYSGVSDSNSAGQG